MERRRESQFALARLQVEIYRHRAVVMVRGISRLIVPLRGLLLLLVVLCVFDAGIGFDVALDMTLRRFGREMHPGHEDRDDDRDPDQQLPHVRAHSSESRIGQFSQTSKLEKGGAGTSDGRLPAGEILARRVVWRCSAPLSVWRTETGNLMLAQA